MRRYELEIFFDNLVLSRVAASYSKVGVPDQQRRVAVLGDVRQRVHGTF